MKETKINFEFEEDLEPVTLTIKEGQTILDICHDNDIPLNHNCGGVCACSTCHIYVNTGDENLAEISDDEEDFIDRAINPKIESRLACQCKLMAALGEINVVIPDQSDIIGHH